MREGESQIIGDVPKSVRSRKKQPWVEWGLNEKQWNYHHPGETETLGDVITDNIKIYGKDNIELADWEDVPNYAKLPHVWVDSGEEESIDREAGDHVWDVIAWEPPSEYAHNRKSRT